MIGKRARASGAAKSGSAHAKSLVKYISDNKNEKVGQYGALNFIAINPADQIAEMAALASSNFRAKNPINHYVVSWKEGEQPSPQQINEAVQIVLDEMGMSKHQAVYCVHQDTENIHMHLVVNRIDPETEKSVTINNGFDLKALYVAVAKIEHAQGWSQEAGSRYFIDEKGELIQPTEKNIHKKPQQRAVDFEQRSGEKSAQRIGIEEAAPAIRNAQSWQQLHQDLGKLGIEFEKKGNGAILIVGGKTAIKPSSIDRAASLGKLEKRLGLFQPPTQNYLVAARPPEPLITNQLMVAEYIEARHSNKEQREEEAQKSKEELAAANASLADKQKSDREKLLSPQWNDRGNFWEGKGDLLNAVRNVMADQQREELEVMQRQFDLERAATACTEPLPDYEGWLRDQDRDNLADGWRYRHGNNPSLPSQTRAAAPRSVEIPDKLTAVAGIGAEAYRQHYQYIQENRRSDNVDMSRIDGEIAVRMRATGHTQAQVEQIMTQCAQAAHETSEGRDWERYGQRAAQYAFGAAGDRQMPRLEAQRKQLLELEQRVEVVRERNVERPEQGFSMGR